MLPDERIDTDEARQTERDQPARTPRQQTSPKTLPSEPPKPQDRDCLRHCATPARQRPVRIPITSHRIAPHCTAPYRSRQKQTKAQRRRDSSKCSRVDYCSPEALGAPQEPAKSRDTAGIASWKWTSATQPVRGFAIFLVCPAILRRAWLAPRWGLARPLSACRRRQSQP